MGSTGQSHYEMLSILSTAGRLLLSYEREDMGYQHITVYEDIYCDCRMQAQICTSRGMRRARLTTRGPGYLAGPGR